MRLASVITPFSDENLALAAQTGVTDITIRYQGPEVADWLPAREQVERHGLKICTVEDALQTEEIIIGSEGRDQGRIVELGVMGQGDHRRAGVGRKTFQCRVGPAPVDLDIGEAFGRRPGTARIN